MIINSYRIRPGLPTNASGAARQGTCGNCATVGLSANKKKKREGIRVKRQREMWKGICTLIRANTLNIGTIIARGRELTEMIEQRNVDILCLQETKWKGSKARKLEVAANYSIMVLIKEEME